MPDKDYPQVEQPTGQKAPAQSQTEQKSQQAAAPGFAPDNSQVMASLKQILAGLQNELQGEATEPPLPPEAQTAINVYNEIVIALRQLRT